MLDFGEGSCCSCCCSCCDRGKTKSTPSPKTEVWTLDLGLGFDKNDIELFSWILDCLLQEMFFQYQFNQQMKPNKTNYLCYLFPYNVKHCNISVFTVIVLYGLSRSQRLHKHISDESKFSLPYPEWSVTQNLSYFFLPNQVENEYLHEIL